jgi:YgiT-type zinc finger domain-containing protein
MGGEFQAEEKKLMKSASCHAEMMRKKGEMDLRIRGKLYLVRNVAFEECAASGEKEISPEVARLLFDKINNKEFVEESIKVPVLEGSYG